jgi:hypothetical protein
MSIIRVSCPGCNIVFEVPPELGGQIGECTECGSTFIIPQLPGAAPPPQPVEYQEETAQETVPEYTNTDTQTSNDMAKTAMGIELDDDEGPTNTVKLSRSSIGMMPDVDDNFSVNVVNRDRSTKAPEITESEFAPPPTATKKSPKKTFTNAKTKKKFESKKPKKKWWQFWK